MGKFKFRLDHVLAFSILVNVGLLGFMTGLFLMPGPFPHEQRGFGFGIDGQHMADISPPEFGFRDRMLFVRLAERSREDLEVDVQRANEARRGFADALAADDPDAEEIVARGEELKAAMRTVGDGFLDIMVTMAPSLGLEERQALANFLLMAPSPLGGLGPGGGPVKIRPSGLGEEQPGLKIMQGMPPGEERPDR